MIGVGHGEDDEAREGSAEPENEITDYNEEEEDYDEEEYDRNSDSTEYDNEDYDENDEATEEEEESEMDPETELLYRSYEILSDFYKKHFVDLRVLDTTCEPTKVAPPEIIHGHIKEYLTTENILVPGQHYHEVIYECDPGYKLTDQGMVQ